MQHTSLIDKHLITFFVPFLPLEREHIYGCIRQQLRLNRENDPYDYEYSEDDLIKRVLNLIEFSSSSSSFEYALSGCKRVQQKLDFVFESIRLTLKRKLKPIKDIL